MPSSRQNVTPNVILWYQPIESSWQDLWSTTAIPPCKINFQGPSNVWFLLGPTCILTMTMPSTLCKNSLPKNTSTESHSWTRHKDSEGATNHTTPTMMQDNNASEISSWSRMRMISHAMQEFVSLYGNHRMHYKVYQAKISSPKDAEIQYIQDHENHLSL